MPVSMKARIPSAPIGGAQTPIAITIDALTSRVGQLADNIAKLAEVVAGAGDYLLGPHPEGMSEKGRPATSGIVGVLSDRIDDAEMALSKAEEHALRIHAALVGSNPMALK